MDYVILILICLAAGGYGGYRIGTLYIRKENAMLQRQLARLENFSHYWSSYSSGSNDLYNNIRQQHTMNLTGTMQSVIQVLQTIQQRQSQELSLEDQRRLSSIIQQSQAISPTSSLDDESAL